MSDATIESATAEAFTIRGPEQEMAELGANAPEAADLSIDEINPLNAHLFREHRWHDHFARLRAEDPVHFNELETAGRYWSVTKYDDVRAVDGDWKTFSSAQGITLGPKVVDRPVDGPQVTLVHLDGSTQTDRAAQHRSFRCRTKEPAQRRTTDPRAHDRGTRLASRGRDLRLGRHGVDRVHDHDARHLVRLPVRRSPHAHPLVRRGVRHSAARGARRVARTKARRDDGLRRYFEVLWEERRKNPGDDLVSMLVHGDATKDMPTAAHLGNLLLLIVGGNDTTRNTMSGSVYGMNKFGDQYDKLIADPTLIPKMVPEIIRWQTPLSYMRRTANHDTETRRQADQEGRSGPDVVRLGQP